MVALSKVFGFAGWPQQHGNGPSRGRRRRHHTGDRHAAGEMLSESFSLFFFHDRTSRNLLVSGFMCRVVLHVWGVRSAPPEW